MYTQTPAPSLETVETLHQPWLIKLLLLAVQLYEFPNTNNQTFSHIFVFKLMILPKSPFWANTYIVTAFSPPYFLNFENYFFDGV